eukprot:3085048-Pleurochrysis_carterae.AAC.1
MVGGRGERKNLFSSRGARRSRRERRCLFCAGPLQLSEHAVPGQLQPEHDLLQRRQRWRRLAPSEGAPPKGPGRRSVG